MLHNTMAHNCLTLFCLVNGEAISQALSVEIDETKTVDHLKGAIKAKKASRFYDVDADELAL